MAKLAEFNLYGEARAVKSGGDALVEAAGAWLRSRLVMRVSRHSGLFASMERLLLHAERTIALIDRCRPLNTRTELGRLVERWEAGDPAVPAWRYDAPPHLTDVRRALDQGASLAASAGYPGALYAGRAIELDREAALAESVGRPAFPVNAAVRFPRDASRAGVAADACAAEWARLSPPADEPRIDADDARDPRSLVRVLGALAGSLGLPLRILIVPDLASSAAAGDGVVLVRPGVGHTESAARRIALHEVVGHALPRLRARGEALGLFRTGSACGADDEEGRALLLEERQGFLAAARRRELGVRHLGATAVRRGADWVELVRLLREHGLETPDAVRLAARIARGGGLAREIVYLPALLRVRAAFAAEPSLETYFERGRVGIAAARTLAAVAGSAVEGRDDGHVVGRLVPEARLRVDLDAGATVRESARRQDQIDAQAVVPLVGAGAVVPPGK
jgi:hypothetical protein